MQVCGAGRGAVAATAMPHVRRRARRPRKARRRRGAPARALARARAGRRGRSRVDVAAARPRPPVLCCSDGAGAAARRTKGRRAPRFLPRRGGGVARSARAQAGNLSCDNCAVSGRCVLQMNYWGSSFSAGSATWRVSRSSSDWLVAWHTLRAGSTLASIVSYGLGRLWISFLSRAGATARGASMAYEFSARGGTGTLSSKASAPTPFRRSRGEELQTSRARAGSLERTPSKMGIHFSYHRDERP